MGLILLVDDEDLERKSFFNVCVDRGVARQEDCMGAPTPEALLDLIREKGIKAESIESVFLDIQLRTHDELDRGGLQGADLLRRELGNVPIIAYTRHTEIPYFADITAHEFDGLLLKQDCSDALRFTSDRFRRLLSGWRRKRGLPAASEPSKVEGEIASPIVLHLSDLQFGRAYAHPKDLADSILQACIAATPNIVVVSGDVAQSGEPREYQDALIFLERLCSGLDIGAADRERVILCPGNHDVNWPLSLGAYVDTKLERRPIPLTEEAVFKYRMAPYLDFRESFYGERQGIGLLRQEPDVRIHDLRAYGMLIVSLNSSEGEDPFNRQGRIDSRIFDRVEGLLKEYGNLEPYAVCAVFHHPLQVGAGSGFAVNASDLILDPTGIARRLWAIGVKLVFTGHIHASSLEVIPVEAGVRDDGLGLINLLAGSAGVPEADRPGTGGMGHLANEFGVLRGLRIPDEWELAAFSFDAASRAFLPKSKFPGPSHVRRVSLLGGRRPKGRASKRGKHS